MENNLRLQKTAYNTIVRKEVLRFSRIWKQTLIPPVITNILYFIIFGNLIGERIGKIDSFTYTDFIFPGLLLMSVITHSYTNTVSSLSKVSLSDSIMSKRQGLLSQADMIQTRSSILFDQIS